MKRNYQKCKGAINVFLVIILVPILIVTCLFVDASRTRLAGGVVSSAGDLTLNTVLTQYDAALDDFYGLLASDQKGASTVISQADTYFSTSVSSKAAKTSGSRGTIDQALSLITGGSGDVVDLLQITVDSNSPFTVTPLKNGTLTNPALIKKQVVEFMKYRAPIDAVGDLLHKFKSVSKDLENASKDSETIEKKQEFADAEGALMATLMEAYTELLSYNEYGITSDYVSNMKTDLDTIEEKYRSAHKITVKNLYNTQGRLLFYEWERIDSDPGVTANSAQVNNYIDETAKAIRDFIPAARSFVNAAGQVPEWSASYYAIQYWVYADDIIHDSFLKFCNKANTLSKAIKKLDLVMATLPDDEKQEVYRLSSYAEVNTAGDHTRKEHYDTLKSQFQNLWSQYILGNDTEYIRICEYVGKNFDKSELQTSKVVNEYIKPVYDKLNEYYTKFDEADKHLKKAYDLLAQAKKDAQEYKDHYNEWSAISRSYSSTLAEEEKEEADAYETNPKKGDILQNATPENIDNLMQRISNIRSLIGSIKKGIDEYKYNGKKVRDIDTYDKFRSASGINKDRISYISNDLESYANESFHFTKSDTLTKTGITESNNPSFSVNKPPMYKWLEEKFEKYKEDLEKGEAENSKKQGEDDKKEVEDKYKKSEEDLKEEGNITGGKEIKDITNRPSASYSAPDIGAAFSSDIKQISGFVSGLFTNFGATCGQAAVNLRDHLYTMSYIFNMFTYDTYNNEGRFRLLEGGATYGNYQSKYSGVNSKWKNEDPEFTDNKTLTNKILNDTTEYSFGNEVEYILYGSSNFQNKFNAYASIFGLRFALNMPAEFIRLWKPSGKYEESFVLEELAVGISVATYGIIPAAVIKLLVILGLTAAEAGRDIQYLKAGMPLELVKGADDLEIKFGTFAPDNNNEKTNTLTSFFYSDYLKLFIFLNLLKSSSEYGIYARTADVIQANMAKSNEGFVLSKSVVYYEASGTVKIKPLMLSLPIVTNNGYNAPEDGGWNTITYKNIRGY